MSRRRTDGRARRRWLRAVLVNALNALGEHRVGAAKAIIRAALEIER